VKYKFFHICFFLFFIKSYGTAQAPDYLILGKDTLKIHSNPLESYFEKHPIPRDLITSINSGNWRGYIAYFKFVDNKLVVDNIYKEDYQEPSRKKYNERIISIYKEIFGEKPNFECTFYSGLLVSPYGKLIEYVHMGYASIYEYYELFEINNGLKTNSKKFTGEEFQKFKIDYFNFFKTTEDYKTKLAEYRQMMLETEKSFEETDLYDNKKEKKKPKENKYLKQKELEYKVDKQTNSFMFLFLDDYIKTIEIPKKN
jgi:hypothetical protein